MKSSGFSINEPSISQIVPSPPPPPLSRKEAYLLTAGGRVFFCLCCCKAQSSSLTKGRNSHSKHTHPLKKKTKRRNNTAPLDLLGVLVDAQLSCHPGSEAYGALIVLGGRSRGAFVVTGDG